MRMMNRFKHLILFTLLCTTAPTCCLSQEFSHNTSNETISSVKWIINGNFCIDSIYQIDMATIFIVSCVDSTDLHWPGFFEKYYHDYRNIRFTIVSFPQKGNKSKKKIKKGHVYNLTLTPIHGVWITYETLGKDGLFEDVCVADGIHIRIPWDEIYNQVMISPNIIGGRFCPNVQYGAKRTLLCKYRHK